MSTPRKVLFVTGLLAEPALRNVLNGMAAPFVCDVAALRITVAALMTTSWIGRSNPDGLGVSRSSRRKPCDRSSMMPSGPLPTERPRGTGITPRPAGRVRSIVV